MKRLNVDVCMSTAYHLQSDGQKERVNQTLEKYQRKYCSDQWDDWFDLIPMAEQVYNLANSKLSKSLPFYANYGYQPQTSWPAPKRKGKT